MGYDSDQVQTQQASDTEAIERYLQSRDTGMSFTDYFFPNQRGRMRDPLPHLLDIQKHLLGRRFEIVTSDNDFYPTTVSVNAENLHAFIQDIHGEQIALYPRKGDQWASTVGERINYDWQTSTLQMFDRDQQDSAFFDRLVTHDQEIREDAIFNTLQQATGGRALDDEKKRAIVWEARSAVKISFQYSETSERYQQATDSYVDTLISAYLQEVGYELSDTERDLLVSKVRQAIGQEPQEQAFIPFSRDDFIGELFSNDAYFIRFIQSLIGEGPQYCALVIAQLEYAIAHYHGISLQTHGLERMRQKGVLPEYLHYMILKNSDFLGNRATLSRVLAALSKSRVAFDPFPFTGKRDKREALRKLERAIQAGFDA